MKALVVDDSETTRRILVRSLVKAEILSCDEAADGREAITACLNNEYDVVLMDWNMPNMSGLDAVKAIRSAGKQVPIIMVTTESEKARVVDAIKAGANNYICKPFQPDVLAAKIKETLLKADT
ncbi:MAG TPA: response regulator [bacterium]|nr:response regulator [bacterium]HPO09269.1 response regulator [bacterium]HQO35341.1 response regulator [bacterium]HQP99756.1 response regulator [bacterium]